MTPEQFLEFARLLPEPLFLLSGPGQVIAVNPPVTTLLGLQNQELRRKTVVELVTNPPEQVLKYLSACSRTREMVPGSLTFWTKSGQTIACRCEGAVVHPASPASAAFMLLRVQPQKTVINRFVLLNNKIDELTKQLRIRWQLEQALRKVNTELEQRVQERTEDLSQINLALRAEIFERKQLEQKLLEAERLAVLGTATAKIAHEIGNPLNGIYTTVQFLERHVTRGKDTTDPVLNSIIDDLVKEIDRLRSLLHELRSFSRSQQLTLQPSDLALVVAEIMALEAHHYTEQGVRIVQDLPPALSLPLADQEKLKQVFLNLCKNAVEAMPDGGTLTIRGHTAAGQVSLEVHDTGDGVPAGIEIFEPFVTTKREGTGLGLAIARQIVLAHRGTLTYTSTPGQGTIFTLTLPSEGR